MLVHVTQLLLGRDSWVAASTVPSTRSCRDPPNSHATLESRELGVRYGSLMWTSCTSAEHIIAGNTHVCQHFQDNTFPKTILCTVWGGCIYVVTDSVC